MAYLDVACRAVLAVVFVTAAVSKLRGRRAFHEFRESLVDFGLGKLPVRLRTTVAATVVALEATAAILLVVDRTAVLGLVLAWMLLASFTVAVGAVLRQGRRVRCRCFGSNGAELGGAQLLRNLLLVCVASAGFVVGLFGGGTPEPVDAPSGGVLLAAVLGTLAGFLVTRWDDLAFLLRRDATHPF